MLKWFGIVLICSAISLYGAYRSHLLSQSVAVRAGLMELLLHLQNGIDHGALPLSELYADFENEALSRTGFCALLKSGEPNALLLALEKSELGLPESMRRKYADFALTLGKSSFRRQESERIDRFIGEIRAENEKTDAENATKRLLYSRLGLIGALLAALILV